MGVKIILLCFRCVSNSSHIISSFHELSLVFKQPE